MSHAGSQTINGRKCQADRPVHAPFNYDRTKRRIEKDMHKKINTHTYTHTHTHTHTQIYTHTHTHTHTHIYIYILAIYISFILLIPLAARSKAWVCGRWFAGIAGSNPVGDVDVCSL